MPISLEDFARQLSAAGILSTEQVRTVLGAGKRPADAQQLARELVRRGLLTRYQAIRAYQGQAGELVLGQYLLLDKLGKGGMGEVFKARHRVMGRTVAIKVLSRSLMSSPDAVKRFQREVKAAALLTHPNIVTAFDASEVNGQHYLVMEYVDGEDLNSLSKREGSIPFEQALHYILQAAQGLAYAHARGVIHRDIKPHNLLVDREGTVKVLDMGLARVELPHDEDSSGSGITASNIIMGTLDYMAPEQASDMHSADQRADIYSLGCTLYRLVVGERVYQAESVVHKIVAHRSAPIPSICSSRPAVPAELDQIFQRMVAKDPQDRYPNIQSVIHDLKALSRGKPIKASPVMPVEDEDSRLMQFFAGSGETVSPLAGETNRGPNFDLPRINRYVARRKSDVPAWLLLTLAAAIVLAAVLGYVLYRRNQPPAASMRSVDHLAHGAHNEGSPAAGRLAGFYGPTSPRREQMPK